VILYAQRRDVIRLVANLGLVPVKLGLLAALVAVMSGAGAIAAAIATVITDAILLAIYVTAIYGPKRSKATT
jgi:hypothetical protein